MDWSWLCFKVCSSGRSPLTTQYSVHALRNLGPLLPDLSPCNNVLQFWQGSPWVNESYLWVLRAYENSKSCRRGSSRGQKCITAPPSFSLRLMIRLCKQIGLKKSLTAIRAPAKNLFEGTSSNIAKTSGKKMFSGLGWPSQNFAISNTPLACSSLPLWARLPLMWPNWNVARRKNLWNLCNQYQDHMMLFSRQCMVAAHPFDLTVPEPTSQSAYWPI